MSRLENREFEPLVGVKLSVLARLRSLAVRRGVWFRVLSRLDRGLVDLVLRVLKDVRSSSLAKELRSIAQKLMEALAGRVVDKMHEIGTLAAQRISRLAQKWGNKTARDWINDMGFVRYLAIMKLNEHLYNG